MVVLMWIVRVDSCLRLMRHSSHVDFCECVVVSHGENPHSLECCRNTVFWSGRGDIVRGRQRGAMRHANVRVQSWVKDLRVRNREKLQKEKLEQLEEQLLMLKVGGEGEGLT